MDKIPDALRDSSLAAIPAQRSAWFVAPGLRLYVLIALALEAVFALYYIVKSKAFCFIDIGSDTFFQFYPLQVAVGKQLRELHSITWSFDLGLGGYLGTLFDPFWLFTAPFPDSWQLGLRLPLYFVKLLLAGGFFYGYLKVIGFRAPLAVFGALAYAFSSYGAINAQWDLILGVEFIQFAAFLFLLETYLRGNKAWAAICAGVVLGLGHPMEMYSFALLTVVYAFARMALAARAGLRAYLASLARFAGWFVLGLLITAPLLFPAIYYFVESPRVSGEHSMLHTMLSLIFTTNDRATIAAEIAGLLGKDILGTGSFYNKGWMNYFEGPGFYVGVLMLVCIPQLLGPHATRRERWLCIIGTLAVGAYFIWPALRYVVYGFGHTAFRFSTLWVSALLLIMGLAGLRRGIDSPPWRWGIALGVGGIFGIVLVCVVLLPQSVNFKLVVLVAIFTVLYAGLFLWTAARPEWRARMLGPLLALFACELLLFAAPAMIERVAVNADGSTAWGQYDDGSSQAVGLIRDLEHGDEFYRVEKTFNSVFLDDALIQGYSGIKSYYFHSASLTRFIDRMQLPRPIAHSNWIGSAIDAPGVLDLVGVKYVLTRNRNMPISQGMTYVGSASGVDVYRNESAHGFGYFYEHIAAEAASDALPPSERDDFLTKNLIVQDPGAISASLAALDNISAPAPTLNADAKLQKLRDDRIEGRVQTPRARALLISMPFDRGWNARLNGNPLELFRADYGLTAALIPAGVHALTLNYEPPGRMLGVWLSAASICLLLAIRTRRRRFVTSADRTAIQEGICTA
jgi:hypothetical protein